MNVSSTATAAPRARPPTPPRSVARRALRHRTSIVAFVVPKDCPVQRLRLELANPRGDADTPGNVAARLTGTAWFDDFLIRGLD